MARARSKQINVRLTDKELRAARRAARRWGVSVSILVRMLLRCALEPTLLTPELETPNDR